MDIVELISTFLEQIATRVVPWDKLIGYSGSEPHTDYDRLNRAKNEGTVVKYKEIRPVIDQVINDPNNPVKAVFTKDYNFGVESEYYPDENGNMVSSHREIDEEQHYTIITGFKV